MFEISKNPRESNLNSATVPVFRAAFDAAFTAVFRTDSGARLPPAKISAFVSPESVSDTKSAISAIVAIVSSRVNALFVSGKIRRVCV